MKRILITFIVSLLLISSVSALNLADLKKTLGYEEGNENFNSDYDLDGDGAVSFTDLGILLKRMLESENCIARANTKIIFKNSCNFK